MAIVQKVPAVEGVERHYARENIQLPTAPVQVVFHRARGDGQPPGNGLVSRSLNNGVCSFAFSRDGVHSNFLGYAVGLRLSGILCAQQSGAAGGICGALKGTVNELAWWSGGYGQTSVGRPHPRVIKRRR